MQRTLLTAALVASFCLATSAAAQAGIATGDTIRMNVSTAANAYSGVPTLLGNANHSTTTLFGPGPGGEFLMTVTGGTAANIGSKYLTFCVETDEYLADNGVYQVIVSSVADAGGSGGPSPDPVALGTQWLFQQYNLGNLDNLTSNAYLYNDNPSGDALQTAIWHLEQETTNVPALSGLSQTLYNLAVANGASYNPLLGAVSIAQLWGSVTFNTDGTPVGHDYHQDQLIFTPGQNIGEVPEVASVVTWCVLGLAAGAFGSRRKLG